MSKKEVITKPQDENALVPSDLGAFALSETDASWGVAKDLEGNEGLYANDLLIPKLWLMQGSSDWVKARDKDHRAGDWANSLTEEILGGPEDSIKFVVISMTKNWQFFWLVPNGDKIDKEFDGKMSGPVTMENRNAEYIGTIDGRNFKRRQVLRFTVLLERDINAGNAQPYVIDFAASSKPGGRALYTTVKDFSKKPHSINGKKLILPSAAAAFELVTSEKDFDGNSVWIKNINFLGYSNAQAVELARQTYKEIDSNDAIEYHEDYEEMDVIEVKGSDDV